MFAAATPTDDAGGGGAPPGGMLTSPRFPSPPSTLTGAAARQARAAVTTASTPSPQPGVPPSPFAPGEGLPNPFMAVQAPPGTAGAQPEQDGGGPGYAGLSSEIEPAGSPRCAL